MFEIVIAFLLGVVITHRFKPHKWVFYDHETIPVFNGLMVIQYYNGTFDVVRTYAKVDWVEVKRYMKL